MNKVILDTDILSEILKGKDATVSENATKYLEKFGFYTTTVITMTELVKGFHKKGRADIVAQIVRHLNGHEVLSLGVEAAVIAGKIYAELEKSGQPIGRADPLIAGIAIERGLTLVTGNKRHFERITQLGFSLTIENWRG